MSKRDRQSAESVAQSAMGGLLAAFQSEPKPCIDEFDYGGDLRREDIEKLLASASNELEPSDVSWYVQSLPHMGATVYDFRYFFPKILSVWSRWLLSGVEDSSLCANLTAALARTSFLYEDLTREQEQAVYRFMRETILSRIAQESSLRIVGYTPSPRSTHTWFEQFAAYGVIGRDMESLWSDLWQVNCIGHAIAVTQYSSCLICEDNDNPIFAPWTSDQGGGVPNLWEYGSMGFEEHWRAENLLFLRATLTPDYLRGRLETARNRLLEMEQHAIIEHLLLAIEVNSELVALRCAGLPELLAKPSETGGSYWETVGAR
jgi:hypothetical protein